MPVRVVRSATNYQSPRFDFWSTADSSFRRLGRDILDDLRADMLELDYVAPDALAYRHRAVIGEGLWSTVEFRARSPRIGCSGDFDRWLKSRNGRSTLMRRQRKLLGRMGYSFEILQTWPEIEPLLREVFDIEASGWKGEQGTAIMQVPEMRSFYTQLAETAAAAGTLRLFLLKNQDSIVAFEFNLLTDGVLYLLKKGFLASQGKHSPGQVLLLQVVRWAFAEPDVRFYDMLGNSRMRDPSKERFITEDYPLFRLRFFDRSVRSAIAWGVYRTRQQAVIIKDALNERGDRVKDLGVVSAATAANQRPGRRAKAVNEPDVGQKHQA